MIISKTPYRISFFGGGTDFPAWFKDHDGAVLSTTIDKFCYISVRRLPPFFHHKHRIVYTDIELITQLNEIKHPSVRECLKFLNITDGVEIHHDGDLPSRSGLGSSSSFTVGLIHALKAYQGQMISQQKLADLAILIERELIGEAGGIQDQIAVAHGGFNLVRFGKSGYVRHNVVFRPRVLKELQSSLCLFFTGKSRLADSIERTKIELLKKSERAYEHIAAIVDEALAVLNCDTFSAKEFGRLFHESWLLKKSLSPEVSNSYIDAVYQEGIKNGAHGGKILGAGGGGFILFCVDSYNKDAFVESMKGLLHVPFQFEYGGSKIALYDPS